MIFPIRHRKRRNKQKKDRGCRSDLGVEPDVCYVRVEHKRSQAPCFKTSVPHPNTDVETKGKLDPVHTPIA